MVIILNSINILLMYYLISELDRMKLLVGRNHYWKIIHN